MVPPPAVMPSLNARPAAGALNALAERMTPLLMRLTRPSTSTPSPSPVTPSPDDRPCVDDGDEFLVVEAVDVDARTVVALDDATGAVRDAGGEGDGVVQRAAGDAVAAALDHSPVVSLVTWAPALFWKSTPSLLLPPVVVTATIRPAL